MPHPSPLPDYTGYTPQKSTRWRPLRRGLQVGFVRLVLGLAPLLPVSWAQALGRGMGALFHRLAGKERRLAQAQLAMALPELSAAQVQAVVRQCFGHFGMTVWELLVIRRIRRQAARWLVVEQEQVLRDALKAGRGVVLLTGHMGNWELCSALFDQLRIKARAVVAPLADPRLNALVGGLRRSQYVDLIWRGDKDSARQLLACLKSGEVLIIAIDQDTEAQGVWVEFFGQQAHTPRVAASLALRDVPVVAMFDVRLPDGRHLTRFQSLPLPPNLPEGAAAEQALTQSFTQAIEAHIRQYPAQWAWFHRRWKHRPPEA